MGKTMSKTTYELWHVASGNFLEDFESEEEALAAVREYLDANGPEMVYDLALGAVPSTGLTMRAETPPFLQGAALLVRVEAATRSVTPSGAGLATPVDRARRPVVRQEQVEETPPEQLETRKAAG